MRVLKNDEEDRTVKLFAETEGRRDLCEWIIQVNFCFSNDIVEESEKQFPDGLTYDEAFEFLRGK